MSPLAIPSPELRVLMFLVPERNATTGSPPQDGMQDVLVIESGECLDFREERTERFRMLFLGDVAVYCWFVYCLCFLN